MFDSFIDICASLLCVLNRRFPAFSYSDYKYLRWTLFTDEVWSSWVAYWFIYPVFSAVLFSFYIFSWPNQGRLGDKWTIWCLQERRIYSPWLLVLFAVLWIVCVASGGQQAVRMLSGPGVLVPVLPVPVPPIIGLLNWLLSTAQKKKAKKDFSHLLNCFPCPDTRPLFSEYGVRREESPPYCLCVSFRPDDDRICWVSKGQDGKITQACVNIDESLTVAPYHGLDFPVEPDLPIVSAYDEDDYEYYGDYM